jgi:putative ABC transport system ATP-binding protein
MVGGLLTPSSGVIEVNGRDIAKLNGRDKAVFRRTTIGYVFQSNNLLPYLTVRENLLVMNAIGGIGKREAERRADQLLEELGLTTRGKSLATQLSGGERQRVAIARALMNTPRLVLVDEPTASLDSTRGKQVMTSLIDEVKSRDVVGIIVTHDVDMARMADRVLEIHDGLMLEATK